MAFSREAIYSRFLLIFLFFPFLFSCGDQIDPDKDGGDDDDDTPSSISITNDGKAPWYAGAEKFTAPGRMQEAQVFSVSSNVIHAEVRLADSEKTGENTWAPEDLRWESQGNEAYIYCYLPDNEGKEARSANYEVKIVTYSEGSVERDSLLGTFTLTQLCANAIEAADTLVTQSSIKLNCGIRGDLIAVMYAVREKQEAYPLDMLEFEGKEQKIEGETIVIGQEGLTHSSVYWLYAVGVSRDNTIDHSTLIEQELATTFPEGDDLSLIFKVSANPANEYTVYLPMADTYEHFYETGRHYQIDWGDGQVETGGTFKHQYKESGKADFYQVKIKGRISTIDTGAMPAQSQSNTIIAVEQWGNLGLTTLQLTGLSSLESIAPDTQRAFELLESMGACDKYHIGSFEDCTALKEIPRGLFDYAMNVKDFNRTFLGCTSLTSVPEDLFAKATKAKDFELTFYHCDNLTEIPEMLFAHNTEATNFDHTFGHCAKLTAIPQQLFWNNAKAINFSGTFLKCTSLTEIPEKLLKGCPHATTFGEKTFIHYNRDAQGMFTGCTALAALPADLLSYCPEATDISAMFAGCKVLKAVPEGFFDNNPRITYCQSTFEDCVALESIPVSLFDNCLRITHCRQMFCRCRSLKGESPYLIKDSQKVHLYDRADYPLLYPMMEDYSSCFADCKGLTDYNTMPRRWTGRE